MRKAEHRGQTFWEFPLKLLQTLSDSHDVIFIPD